MMCMKNFTIRSNTFTQLTHTGVQSKIYDVALKWQGSDCYRERSSERYIKERNNEQDQGVSHSEKSEKGKKGQKRGIGLRKRDKIGKIGKNGDRSVNQSAGGPAVTWFGLFCSLKNSLLDLLRNVWTAKKMCLLWVYFSGRCGFSPHSRI